MAEWFDPEKDMDVLKSGAFGSGVAATAALSEQYARATEALREERLLEAQRKRQLIDQANRAALQAQQEADTRRRIQEGIPDFLGKVQNIVDAPEVGAAKKKENLMKLQIEFPEIAVQDQVKGIVSGYTSSFDERIAQAKARRDQADKVAAAQVEGLIKQRKLKQAAEFAKTIGDAAQQQEARNKITEARQGSKSGKIEAEKGVFNKMVTGAKASLDSLYKLTEPTPVAEDGLDIAGATTSPSEKAAPAKVQLLNQAEDDFLGLFGKEATDELFGDVNVDDTEDVRNVIDKARRRIRNIEARANKKPRQFFKKWDPEGAEGKTRPATPQNGSGGGF